MRKPRQIVLFRFPQTNHILGILRPALLIKKIPGAYNDWLICMISTQLQHYITGFDELIDEDAPDFYDSGLKAASVIRVGRLAVVEERVLIGSIGDISAERLMRIREKLAYWLTSV
jgi:mRNA interferase MazF